MRDELKGPRKRGRMRGGAGAQRPAKTFRIEESKGECGFHKRYTFYEVARGPVPVAKLESLESRLDHVSERKGFNLT